MNESELKLAIDALPRNIKPQRDLWSGIDQRLKMTARGRTLPYKAPWWRTPAMAAALLLTLAGGIFIGKGLPVAPGEQTMQSAMGYALLGTVAATEREYQAAFQELVPLNYSGLRLEGAEPDALSASWEDLIQAEVALLAALREYPSNLYLNEKLLNLRSQQLQFVKQLALLEQNNWRKT